MLNVTKASMYRMLGRWKQLYQVRGVLQNWGELSLIIALCYSHVNLYQAFCSVIPVWAHFPICEGDNISYVMLFSDPVYSLFLSQCRAYWIEQFRWLSWHYRSTTIETPLLWHSKGQFPSLGIPSTPSPSPACWGMNELYCTGIGEFQDLGLLWSNNIIWLTNWHSSRKQLIFL
jgi:hypothetical protein